MTGRQVDAPIEMGWGISRSPAWHSGGRRASFTEVLLNAAMSIDYLLDVMHLLWM